MKRGLVQLVSLDKIELPDRAYYIVEYEDRLETGESDRLILQKHLSEALRGKIFVPEWEIRWEGKQAWKLREIQGSEAPFEVGSDVSLFFWDSDDRRLGERRFFWTEIVAIPYTQNGRLQYFRYKQALSKKGTTI